jgi:hypothetical protein
MKKLVVGMMVLCAAPVTTTVAMETEQLSPAQTPNTSASQTPSPQNGEKKHSPRTSPTYSKSYSPRIMGKDVYIVDG